MGLGTFAVGVRAPACGVFAAGVRAPACGASMLALLHARSPRLTSPAAAGQPERHPVNCFNSQPPEAHFFPSSSICSVFISPSVCSACMCRSSPVNPDPFCRLLVESSSARQLDTPRPPPTKPRPRRYMKLLVVGESGLGKTTFVRNLFAPYAKTPDFPVADATAEDGKNPRQVRLACRLACLPACRPAYLLACLLTCLLAGLLCLRSVHQHACTGLVK